MCDEKWRREIRDKQEDVREEFYADASCIVKKSFIGFIKGYPREDYAPPWPKPLGCVYPKANAYYAFHEDTNPFTRFPARCESRKYGDVRPHFPPPEEPYMIRDPYYETEARKKYLACEPTCFVVLGKPDLSTAKLAKMIANFWNCVLISPLALINEEIERGSEKGKAIANILKAGECLGPEIVMDLVLSRVNKRDVFHKGYVVEGLPLISNGTLDYSSYVNSNEKSNSQNTSDNLMKFFDSPFHRICGPENEHRRSSNKLALHKKKACVRESEDTGCTKRPDYERFISSQIEEIFTTWPRKPTIIIYAMCPDEDVVRKREHFRIDPITGRIVDTSLFEMSKNAETLFVHNKLGEGMNISFELYQELMNEEKMLNENQRKYLLRRPADAKSNIEAQCALYKYHALPVIEKWIVLHNPQNVIRVDARSPVSLMFQIVLTRLRTLPVPRVILPKKFVDQVAFEFEGESPTATVPTDEFEEKPIEEVFQDLANRETISPLFPWRLSAWNFLCPVELAMGRTVEGEAKYAIKFMNKIFFLSSAEAVDLFIENPRTFLYPFTPRPTCKLVVFGPKYSGKSELCQKLARILKGTVINVNEIGKSLDDVDSNFSFYSPFPKIDERTNMIVNAIQNIPKEELDIEVWRDGGYIVDGMYPDADCWKILVDDSEIVFEDAILLFDEDPYDYLLSKWEKMHHIGHEYEGDDENRENEEEMYGLIDYLNHIRKFESDWKAIEEKVVDSCRNLIACNIGKIDDASSYVMSQIEDRYTEKARVMTEEEKEKEKDLAEYMAMTEDTEDIEDEEEEEREGEKARTGVDIKEDNRRFGDTNYYCPVALLKHNAFWKGKEEFSAVFMDKIYYLSSESALEEFLRGPQKLGLPLKKPLPLIPPLRISVIGPTGSGKSVLSDALAHEYGLAHIDYFQSHTMYIKSSGGPEISCADVIVLSHELLEVELPTDVDDERYNSDSATIQTFVRSYWKNGGTLPKKMYQECILKYFKGLYGQCGVVLDEFPSCPEDVEIALKNYLVPEVIIELRCGKDTAYERMMPLLLELWQDKLEEKKAEESLRYTEELEDYKARRDAWIEQMLEKNPRKRRSEDESEIGEFEDEEFIAEYMEDQEEETVVLTSFELEEIWYRDHPQPVLFTDWETEEAAKERMDRAFYERYDSESVRADAVRAIVEGEPIMYVSMDGEGDSADILLRIMRILDPYVRRSVATLEKVYTVDVETAETLLNHGYYLLSSFGRWCPIQLYQNKVPLQMFLPQEAQQEIHAVIHRQFIYFLSQKEAHSAFLSNPLKYLEIDSYAPVIPFRVAIIGPPKCGKSTLAERFAKKYNMKLITRGAALRHVIKHFVWTEFVESAESSLRLGQMAPMECVYRAVEMCSIDPASVSQGFVLDGFPVNREEYEALALLNIQPMVILDLKAGFDFCLDCLSQGADYTTKPRNFSKQFLAHRYAIWHADYENYRGWLQKFTQNVIEIDATMCRWYVWTRADEKVCSRYMTIRSYFRESDYEKVHSLKYMSVSRYEFTRRQSHFEFYCPMCLYLDDMLIFSGPPPDQKGMVQFREHFYWICPQHLEQFVQNPKNYLPPVNDKRLPKERPRIITETIDPEHPCWTRRLQVGGFCLVTYVDCLPDRRLVPGKISLAVIYKGKVYVFCTKECRDKFLAQPEIFTSVDIKFLRQLPPVDIHKLPNLGFLEQTVAHLVIRAVNQVSVVRPKLPGLSPSATAAIYVGVFLKAHNKSCSIEEVEIYKEVVRRIRGFEKILKVATRTMKRQLNPSLHLPGYKTRRVPVPDARFDYLCEYFKPASKVPAFLNVVDIAGLVKGAAEGQGLGNNFLSHINACDGIFHLARAFDDDDVTHIEGDVNPVRDLEIISEELRLKDIEFLNGHLEKLEKLVVRGNDKKLKPEYDTLLKVKGILVDEKRHIRFADWSATDIEVLNKYLFLTSKPVIYLVNLSEKDYIRKKNKWLIKIKEWVDKNDPGAILIPFSGVFENKLLDMNEAERAKYLEENKVTSALDKIIVQGYKALQLQYFFTAGHDEVKAWTIQKGTKAPQAAGKIHTDFEKGFIMAEVMKYEDFKNEGSEAAVKAAGKYRQQGRNYVVEDGDIIFFKFNAGAGLKDAKKK